jgi:GTPase
MVAANNGLIGMSKEHLGIALALNVPVMVVITKVDICPPQILEQTITQLSKILKSPGARKIPVFIKNREECINTAVSSMNSSSSLVTNREADAVCLPTNMPYLSGIQCHGVQPGPRSHFPERIAPSRQLR